MSKYNALDNELKHISEIRKCLDNYEDWIIKAIERLDHGEDPLELTMARRWQHVPLIEAMKKLDNAGNPTIGIRYKPTKILIENQTIDEMIIAHKDTEYLILNRIFTNSGISWCWYKINPEARCVEYGKDDNRNLYDNQINAIQTKIKQEYEVLIFENMFEISDYFEREKEYYAKQNKNK